MSFSYPGGEPSSKASLRIVRYCLSEPDFLNLEIFASNGQQSGAHEFYCNVDHLRRAAKALAVFPSDRNDEFLWTLGSDYQADLGDGFSSFRVFVSDSLGHCAIQLRFNNNLELPDRAVTDFCIKTEAAKVNLLGELFSDFARLKHGELWWNAEAGGLDDEQAREWASFRKPR